MSTVQGNAPYPAMVNPNRLEAVTYDRHENVTHNRHETEHRAHKKLSTEKA